MWEQFWNQDLKQESTISEDAFNEDATSSCIETMKKMDSHDAFYGANFAYKMKHGGVIHRFTASASCFDDFSKALNDKIGKNLVVCYQDEEGDKIIIGNDADLSDAVHFARRSGHSRLLLLQQKEEAWSPFPLFAVGLGIAFVGWYVLKKG